MADRKNMRLVTATEKLLGDIRDGQDEILAELRKLNGGGEKQTGGVQEPVPQPSTRSQEQKAPAKKAPAKKTAAKKSE